MEGDATAFVGVEAGVVVDHEHEVFGSVVGDFPEADDLAFGSGDREGAAESVDAFAVGGGAEAGFAGGEGDEFEVDDQFFYFPRVEPHGRAGFEPTFRRFVIS